MLANYSKALLLQAGEYNTSLVTLEYTHTSIHSHNHTFYILYYHNDSLELYHCFSVCFLFIFSFIRELVVMYIESTPILVLYGAIYIYISWSHWCISVLLSLISMLTGKSPNIPNACSLWSLAVLVHCDAGHSWGFRWSGRWLGTPCFILALGEGC